MAVGVLALTVTLSACGGEGAVSASSVRDPVRPAQESPPSIQEMATCLKRAGGTAEPLEFESGKEMAAARAADGDAIFIIPLPDPGLGSRASRAIKEGLSKAGREEGLMTTTSVDRGSTLIVLIGIEGVDGGVASLANEELARECATRPHPDLSDGQQA